MAELVRAYRYALEPTAEQDAALRSHCGGQRFAYNWGLALVKANADQRGAERSYGVEADQLTAPLNWSAYSLRKYWNQAKDEVAPWWSENSKEAYSSGLANLAAALRNWDRSRSGTCKRSKLGFPRFKSRRSVLSCRFTTGAFGLADHDRRHVKLPRIGVVRTHESTRKLARRVERGTARIRSATVSLRQGRWHVSLSVEIRQSDPVFAQTEPVVGVDLGLKVLAVMSTGETVSNPKHLESAQRALRRFQRQAARRNGPDRSTGRTPSQRWCKSRSRVARLHAHVANARRDGLHKFTTRLVRACGTVVIEDLNVAGMLRNRTLARHIAGAGLAELRRQVEYKTTWAGVRLHIADRWFPSSKTCSGCGAVKAKLRLSERTYHCQACGLVLDRDLNAARNLAALVEGTSSVSCTVTVNEPDGNLCKSSPRGAAGTATGRPLRSTPRREATAQDTFYTLPER
ncbi:IS607 family element RNA-guided endonuclease TnpB [Lentzea sp. E54]|uniref:IS607 family element RNA-guided endonuclease TnpB n=1 Tax=Lentzea xerophila TaxID=3435883 RepID=UPI003DA205E2